MLNWYADEFIVVIEAKRRLFFEVFFRNAHRLSNSRDFTHRVRRRRQLPIIVVYVIFSVFDLVHNVIIRFFIALKQIMLPLTSLEIIALFVL